MIKSLVTLSILAVIAAASYQPISQVWQEWGKTHYRTQNVERRSVTVTRSSTGEVKPVLEVSIGSFVSGPIEELNVDFNDRVKADQVLAKIDTRIYEAAVARDQAALVTSEAEVKRVAAELQRAINNEKRAIALREESRDYISRTELDQFYFNRKSLEAQLEVARSAVKQSEANLSNSKANLEYTDITSPVDGIIIDKKIDLGQTLAAQFQTPEMFIVAPNMESKMHVFANVDEADIGLIRRAQQEGQRVRFAVDAYPDEVFDGTIEQIRFSSTVTQNVVTYPVVVAAPNPDLKLLPGMTATLEFKIEEKENILCVPNPALRFFPPKKELVREADQHLLEADDDDNNVVQRSTLFTPVDEKRHVWVASDDGLRAIEVVTGVTDNIFTQITEGDLEEGQALVTGIKPKDE